MPTPETLRLTALDTEDLVVLSSAIQDAIVKVGEIRFDTAGRFFTLLVNRFRWELPDYGKGERVVAALRVDGVLGVKARGIDRSDPDALAVLLSAEFSADDEPPGGQLTLTFAGGGAIQMAVECIDVTLVDVSKARRTGSRPNHDLESSD